MKLFITVGAQMPFDRMIKAIDRWLFNNPEINAFAQVGSADFQPKNMEWAEFIEPAEYKRQVIESDLLVAHAGMGSIITALQYGKPIVILPRRAHLRETRNDHQVATAEHFSGHTGIYPVFDENDLPKMLASVPINRSLNPISRFASDELLARIKGFINS